MGNGNIYIEIPSEDEKEKKSFLYQIITALDVTNTIYATYLCR